MTRKVDFYDFEEARRLAGLFFDRMLIELDISARTYYRWQAQGHAPAWALRIIELLSGDLKAHGWQGWQIRRGVLYYEGLNARYHSWTPAQVLTTIYANQNGAIPDIGYDESHSSKLGRKEKAVN